MCDNTYIVPVVSISFKKGMFTVQFGSVKIKTGPMGCMECSARVPTLHGSLETLVPCYILPLLPSNGGAMVGIPEKTVFSAIHRAICS